MFAIGGIVQCDVPFVASPPMNLRIFFWSLTAALAGFLFGFDTVVISGFSVSTIRLFPPAFLPLLRHMLSARAP